MTDMQIIGSGFSRFFRIRRISFSKLACWVAEIWCNHWGRTAAIASSIWRRIAAHPQSARGDCGMTFGLTRFYVPLHLKPQQRLKPDSGSSHCHRL